MYDYGTMKYLVGESVMQQTQTSFVGDVQQQITADRYSLPRNFLIRMYVDEVSHFPNQCFSHCSLLILADPAGTDASFHFIPIWNHLQVITRDARQENFTFSFLTFPLPAHDL